jgi:hypothetical protein
MPGLYGQQLTLKGIYRGKNVFLQNPILASGKTYCIKTISVNGKVMVSSPKSSAVQISLEHLSLDTPVQIEILHDTTCSPKILNAYVLEENTGFRFIQTTVDNASVSWLTTGESPGKGEYHLEKLKIDGWEVIKIVPAKGNLDSNQYSLAVAHYSGDNQFRVIYELEGRKYISEEFSFYSAQDPVSYFPVDEVETLLSLSRVTDYKIKTLEGKLVMQGIAMDINVEGLPYGEYLLIIENREEIFYKPEPEKD